jgi:hypothetical protein
VVELGIHLAAVNKDDSDDDEDEGGEDSGGKALSPIDSILAGASSSSFSKSFDTDGEDSGADDIFGPIGGKKRPISGSDTVTKSAGKLKRRQGIQLSDSDDSADELFAAAADDSAATTSTRKQRSMIIDSDDDEF